MANIKSWILVICLVCIAAAIYEMLVPSGKMQKSARFLICVFILISIIAPIQKTFNGFKDSLEKSFNKSRSFKSGANKLPPYYKFNQQAQEQFKTQCKHNLEKKMAVILQQKRIIAKKILISMDTNEDNCISISKIEIYIKKEEADKNELIKKLVEQNFTVIPKIIAE